ncbi:MAG: baseplate J/gp47 family protein [Brevinemataceae bacterium]
MENTPENYKTSGQIYNEIKDEIQKQSHQNLDFRKGGIFRLILETIALFIAKIYKELDSLLPNVFCQTATDKWLDNHAANLGLSRIPCIKTRGIVTLFRREGEKALTIAPNRTFSTRVYGNGMNYQFFSIKEEVFPAGVLELDIEVEAESTGIEYNVSGNSITEIKTPISGVDRVRNPDNWIRVYGTDLETDEDLRLRCLGQWKGLNGANKTAYESWARSFSGINQVLVEGRPGFVEIYILGVGNSIPDEKLISKVQEYIDLQRPIACDSRVKIPFVVDIDLKIDVFVDKSLTMQVEQWKEIVGDKVDEFFELLLIGQDFESSALIAKIFELPGIKAVNIPYTDRAVIESHQIAKRKGYKESDPEYSEDPQGKKRGIVINLIN